MKRHFILKKLLILLLSLFTVVTLTFFLMKALPGDPFSEEQDLPVEIMQKLQSYYGLDKPLFSQYLTYLKGIVQGNLGPSLFYEGRTIQQIITENFFPSFVIGLEALLIALSVGIFLGSIAALKEDGWGEKIPMGIAMLSISLPNFLTATLLQYFLAIKFPLFPIARFESFSHTILPALSLAALPSAFIARLTRASMGEVLKQPYIKTAAMKGISTFSILFIHALRNAIIPVIAYLGPLIAHILTGSFVIEKIFGIPGLGQWFVMGVVNRDYPIILGLALFFSFFLLITVFLSDIAIYLLDPKIRTSRRNFEKKADLAYG